ncbi:hypothetical protein ACFIQG_20235 [Comamonas odontotermitis]
MQPTIWPQCPHLGPCYFLRPVGYVGRDHYKTVARFEREYFVPPALKETP